MMLGIAFAGGAAAKSNWVVGAVYTENNNSVNNGVMRIERFADGSLGSFTVYSTGGKGTGVGFHSQGAVTLSSDGEWLLAVNAGSN